MLIAKRILASIVAIPCFLLSIIVIAVNIISIPILLVIQILKKVVILFITLVWIGFIGLFIYGLSSLGFSETLSMFTVPTIGILILTLILSIFTFISDKIPDFLGIVSSFFLSIPKFLWGAEETEEAEE
ncbi:hypothetical protein [Enterococcus faecium]|uniref:Uncharacterized protein n=2 Tax=Enterococcus faecium TaxID=1352 RepID=A0A3F3LX35_ENTFC|nr:hypothetical protein [Enterococcus faecium]VTQ68766.1 Uncharacterised protein [Enterococcus hirae]HAP5330572.1 hypothetical protein [Enterococcus faecalis]EGP0010990.1 hypothetical protein [Enterococcus faecium]EGP4907746.1 hypothetical protein [Enterococcus faecium]EGP4947742.1 hypothetical protein [Enterococcus faecium]